MLTENENIDKLFRDKLGSHEEIPPAYLWGKIQGNLGQQHKSRRATMIRSFAIAASIVLAFLAGWMMTHRSDIPVKEQVSIEKIEPKTVEQQAQQNNSPIQNQVATSNPDQNSAANSALKTLATFAPSVSNLKKDNNIPTEKTSRDIILFETEEEFLKTFKLNSGLIKRFDNWMKSFDDKKSDNSIIIPKKENKANQQFAFNQQEKLNIDPRATKDKTDKWSLKAEIAPIFTEKENPEIDPRGYYRPDIKSENTFSGGMVASYEISDRISVKSGLIYSKLKQSARNTPLQMATADNLYANSDKAALAAVTQNMLAGQVKMPTTAQKSFGDMSILNVARPIPQTDVTQNIGYMEIPVAVTYKIIDNKIDVGISGGISTNILVGNHASISENGQQIASGETSNLRDIVYSGTAGIEVGYEISDRITLTVEPRLKRFVNSISKNESVNFQPYQVGVYTGISYKFN